MVDGLTAYAVSVCELALGVVLGNVYHQVDTMAGNQVEDVFALFIGPAYRMSLDSVGVQEPGCTIGGVYTVAVGMQQTACVQHVDFAFDVA